MRLRPAILFLLDFFSHKLSPTDGVSVRISHFGRLHGCFLPRWEASPQLL